MKGLTSLTVSFGLALALIGLVLFSSNQPSPSFKGREIAQQKFTRSCSEIVEQLFHHSSRATQEEFEQILKIADQPQTLSPQETKKIQYSLQRLSSSLRVYASALETTWANKLNKEQLQEFVDQKMLAIKQLSENLSNPEVLKVRAEELRLSLAFLFPEQWFHQQVRSGPYGLYDFDSSKYRWPKLMNTAEVDQLLPHASEGKRFMANIRHQKGYFIAEMPTSEQIEEVSYRWIRLVKGLPLYHAEILVKFKEPIELISQTDPLKREFLDSVVLSTYAGRAPGENYNPLIGFLSKRYTRVDAIETLATHQNYHEAKNSEIHHLKLNLTKDEIDNLFVTYIERANHHRGNTAYNTLFCSCITSSFDFLDRIRKPQINFPKLPFFFEFQLKMRGLIEDIKSYFRH